MSYMTRAESDQITAETTTEFPSTGAYVGASLVPILGIIFAIVAFGRGKVGPGFALVLTSAVAWGVWALLLAAMVANGTA